MATSDAGDGGRGLLHLLGRDGAALCGGSYGFLTASVARCSCLGCLTIWEGVKHNVNGRPAATDDSDEIGH